MDVNNFLGELNKFNDTLDEGMKFKVIDGSQFENPEFDEDDNIVIRDQDGNIINFNPEFVG